MNRVSLSIGIMFLIVLAIYIPGWLEPEVEAPISETEEAWQPNYQARNMRSNLYDESGQLSHQIIAEKMEHYQLLGFTLFTRPEYNIYVKNQPFPWQITAGEGTLYENNRIQLETDVEIRTLNAEGYVQSVKTSFIEINLTDKTMHSDQAVEIVGHGFTIFSDGFTADLNKFEYQLTDNVRSIYAPN